MLTSLVQTVHKARFLLNDNSHTILTGVGVVGTVATAVTTGRASFKAAQIIRSEEKKKELENPEYPSGVGIPRKVPYRLSRFEKGKLVWTLYIPPAGVCLTTIVSIVAANRLASKKIAALAVASAISERSFQEYKAKVEEKLTQRQSTNIRDEIAQDRVNKNPVNSREVILAGTGEVLCYDMTTGRYFQSTVEEIKRAENHVNHQLNNFMSASLSEFYDEIGLPPTSFSDNVGWNTNNHLKVVTSAVMSSDNRPCIAIDFENPPFADYGRLHD